VGFRAVSHRARDQKRVSLRISSPAGISRQREMLQRVALFPLHLLILLLHMGFDLLLRSKGQPGLALHPPENGRTTPEPADPADPGTIGTE
jgi:hypothetical protein